MQINVENVSGVKYRITISADAARVKQSRDKLLNTLRKQALIRGFRPGHAPRNILERYYGEQMNEEVRNELLEEGLKKAVEDHELNIVSRPEIVSSALGEDGVFSAEATVEVSPKIEPKDYEGLTVKRRKVEVSDEAVNHELEHLAKRYSKLQTITEERPAQMGDIVEIDFVGTKDGTPFSGGQAENYLLELGSKSFVAGFEEGVAGMAAGEEKDVPISFPENYGNKDLNGANVNFHVTMKAIKTRVVPAIDDEFAKDVSEKYQSLEDLKAERRKMLEEDARQSARDFDRGSLVDALLAVNDFDVPESMVAGQTSFMVERTRQSMSYSGLQKRDIDALMEGAAERMRPEAVKEVKAMLLLEAIAAKESLDCTEEDLEKKFAELAERFRKSPLEISAEYQKENRVEDLKFGIRQDKVIDFLLEKAVVEWVATEKQEHDNEDDDHEEIGKAGTRKKKGE